MFLGWECVGCQNGHNAKEFDKVPEKCLVCGEKLFRRVDAPRPDDGLYPERKAGTSVAGIPMHKAEDAAEGEDAATNINPSLGDWLGDGFGNSFKVNK